MRDWAKILIAHDLDYKFLSCVFYAPPSKPLIDTLAAEAPFDAGPLETSQSEVETGLELLRSFCMSWHDDQLESLQHDYRRLFIGPGHLLAAAITEIRTFMNEHLLQWTPDCLQLVIKHNRSDYYRGCAHLTLGCLAHTSKVIQLETA